MKIIKATCIREERTVWKKAFEVPDDFTDDQIHKVIWDDVGNTDDDPAWEAVDAKTLDLDVVWVVHTD